MKRIVVDAGHGLSSRRAGVYDPGAVAYHGGFRYEEAEIVMDYALTLKAVLVVSRFHVVLTRSRTTRMVGGRLEFEHTPAPLVSRVLLYKDADAGVSLHLNASENSQSRGFEVFYRFQSQKPFAESIYNEIANLVRDIMPLRGVKQANFAILNTTKPAVLIELGFITNPIDAQFVRPLDVQEYRQRRLQIANAIDRGIRRYFGMIP